MGLNDAREQLEACKSDAIRYEHSIAELEARIAAALALHYDRGASEGYTDTGYGLLDHCCATCGSFGEYSEEWPCPTALALDPTLTTEPA